MKDRNLNRPEPLLIMAIAGLAMGGIQIAKNIAKRNASMKAADEAADSLRAWTHFADDLEALNADLDKRIMIAKKALNDAEFFEITKDLEE